MAISVKVVNADINLYIKDLNVAFSKVKNKIFKHTKKEVYYLRDQMRKKLDEKNINFTGRLSNSLVVTSTKGKNDSTVTLFCTAPYGAAMEFGVTPHWVSVYDKPELQQWIDKKYRYDKDLVNPNYILIGGLNSNIRKEESKNEFFFNTIDEYIQSNRYVSKTRKILKDAIKEIGGK